MTEGTTEAMIPLPAVLRRNGKSKLQVANTRSPCQPLFPSNYKKPLQKIEVARHICIRWRLIWAKKQTMIAPSVRKGKAKQLG